MPGLCRRKMFLFQGKSIFPLTKKRGRPNISDQPQPEPHPPKKKTLCGKANKYTPIQTKALGLGSNKNGHNSWIWVTKMPPLGTTGFGKMFLFLGTRYFDPHPIGSFSKQPKVPLSSQSTMKSLKGSYFLLFPLVHGHSQGLHKERRKPHRFAGLQNPIG